jgi:hypothetical protein
VGSEAGPDVPAGDGVEIEPELRFLGPLLSVENVEEHLPLLANVLGLEARAIQHFDPAQVQAIWGVEGRSAGSVLLETGASRIGACLVQFAGTEERPLPARRRAAADPEASPELRFLTRDFEVARHVLERAGFSFRAVSRYSAPGLGRFTEARLLGPEGVPYSVLRMHDEGMERWVRITDRLFGELLSVTVRVPDLAAASAFYGLIGLHPVHRAPVAWPGDPSDEPEAAGAAAGHVAESAPTDLQPADTQPIEPETIDPDAHATSAQETSSFGTEPRAPILTLTRAGAETAAHAASSLEESLVTRLGVVGLRFQIASIDPIRRKLWTSAGQRCGARVLSLGRGIVEPMGAVESMMVRGPGGMLHQFLGRL